MVMVKEWGCQGLRCRILDGPFKNFNGYVGVPKTHPYWGLPYEDVPVRVHGGLTFGSQGYSDTIFEKIKRWFHRLQWKFVKTRSRKMYEGGSMSTLWPDKNLWWFGWDTSHLDDKICYGDGDERGWRVWSMDDVAHETEKLAIQLELHSSDTKVNKNG